MRLSSIPLSAWVGLIGIAVALFCAIFAPWIAPFGERDVVGDIWLPMAATSCSAPTISAGTFCPA